MKNKILEFRKIIVEKQSQKNKLTLNSLPYDRNDLNPVMSKNTIDYHYGTLAKTYVERYNSNEGDENFNFAGAFLHNIFFPQLKAPQNNNKPKDQSLDFINEHFKSFDNMKEEFTKVAMGIQGSGWVYLSKSGTIKTITNHEVKNDIVILIDWWEHAWALDYQADKSKYLKNIWSVINWEIINDRLTVKGGD